MKTCIVYATKYGTAKLCAKELQEILKCDVFSAEEVIDLSSYDQVIVGSCVYAGSLHKDIKKFCENYEQELIKKKLAVYLCGLHTEPAVLNKILYENFKASFADTIQHIYGFGGILDFTKMNWMEKQLIKMINKKENFLELPLKKKAYDFLNREEIKRCIKELSY